MNNRKVIIFAPPFSGHANVLLAMVRQHPEVDFHFVFTGWENIPIHVNIPAQRLDAPPLEQTDPALWTLPRVAQLLPECLRIAELVKPDVIVYDFFSLEGHIVGKLLGIPTWCSIPALLGPSDRSYLDAKLLTPENQTAIRRIRETTGFEVAPESFEVISDGMHQPGDLDLVWSYPSVTPPAFRTGRADVTRVFVGNPFPREGRGTGGRIVLLSFGTVVMDNLWNQQTAIRTRMIRLIEELTRRWGDSPFQVWFITQGRYVLPSYPRNWKVIARVDQCHVLDETAIFVTHAGSNGFHEALVRKVPMVAVPFFGDQPLVARRIEELGVGLNVGRTGNIDTRNAVDALDDGLGERIDKAVEKIRTHRAVYAAAYERLDLKASPLGPLLAGRIPFEEGDLLYGTNIARTAYVNETAAQDDFHLFKFLPFSQMATRGDALPRIVDIYHDAIRDENAYAQEAACDVKPYADLIRDYREHLAGETDIGEMCLRGLDFFTQRFRVHFILEDYDPKLSTITTKEILYVLGERARFEGRVIFYKKVAGTWAPWDFEAVATWLRWLVG